MDDPTPEVALRDIAPRLRAMGVPFALVGGLAVSIHGEARFTRDVERAIPMRIQDVGEVPIARPEELLAMKVLSMSERRRQDLTDAVNLVLCNRDLDLAAVKENIAHIIERGFNRSEDLFAKLDKVLSEARADEDHA